MTMRKVKNTHHAYIRAKERIGITKKEAERLIKEAYFSGVSVNALNDCPIKRFLARKAHYRRKRIKIYKGYVFVFCSTSTKCITMYKIKQEILDAQREWEKQKECD